ncbi:MAG: chorismate synthase [Candidatus Puniceispirillum sp. TMED52]|nr:chorismate synthase [SAR116 cluster bacterium]OUU52450.1 MAG: chorismate synthase [Candidatus Puniceispirillum sp. TMED52]
MADNSFGTLFRFTTFGESHGSAIGCIVDGIPPLLALDESLIQPFLDRRKPGTSRFVTQRREADKVRILSGVFEGKTTGTPVALMIENTDQRSKDYSDIAQQYRPGHADYTYDAKYGIRDYRGGGRSSARETASRVAAGAIAHQLLAHTCPDINIRGAVVQIGEHAVNRDNWNWEETRNNPFFSPDPAINPIWESFLDETRKLGSSAGAVIEIVADGVPAGLGGPIYNKLDAQLAAAIMSINAVKGVEIGDGFAAAAIPGHLAGDAMRADAKGKPIFTSNHAGGVLGGISSGQPLVVRFVVKPTSSILTPRQSIDSDGNEIEVMTKGRHDPCVGIRAVPIGEAMMAIVLADMLMQQHAQCGLTKPE